MEMTRKQAMFIFVCQGGSLSIVTYLYMVGFFDSKSVIVNASQYIDLFLTYGVFPVAWLLIAVQAWQVFKNRN